MPSRNVAIQHEVYGALRKEKRSGESFTQLFVRLLNQRGTLDDLRGSWGPGRSVADHRLLDRLRRRSSGGRR